MPPFAAVALSRLSPPAVVEHVVGNSSTQLVLTFAAAMNQAIVPSGADLIWHDEFSSAGLIVGAVWGSPTALVVNFADPISGIGTELLDYSPVGDRIQAVDGGLLADFFGVVVPF